VIDVNYRYGSPYPHYTEIQSIYRLTPAGAVIIDPTKKAARFFSGPSNTIKTPRGDEVHPGYCAAEF